MTSVPSSELPVDATTEPRLQSIDALRGFDMFWIIRGDAFFKSLATWLGFPIVVTQLEHVKWDGFHFYDLIFPLFLYLVGVVLPFSLTKYQTSRELGQNRAGVYTRIIRRTLLLIALGLIGNGILQLDFSNFRWPGVLQRIGICYFFAALAVLHLGIRGQTLLVAGILGGYWALLRFVPAPGFEPFDLTMEGSLVGYVDRLLIPGKLHYKLGDNEGVLSTIPAIGTTLLGVLTGHWLRSSYTRFHKFLGLCAGAVVCLAAGYLWSFSFPLNKILWTSSFVLVTGGWSLTLLAIFYLLIDVIGWRRWAFFFIVIGMNAITIYVMQNFVDFNKMSEFFLGGVIRYVGQWCTAAGHTEGEKAQRAVLMFGILTLKWLMLWFLYRKRAFLRV